MFRILSEKNMPTIHTANITEVHNVPFNILLRPFPSELNEEKVQSLVDTIQDKRTLKKVPPLDVLWIKGSEGGNYYYLFGGCHRYEAYKRLQFETVPCKIMESTIEDLRLHLGESVPNLK